ncbi:hypothetical protein MBLNU457_4121t1 [Dothideomycetes sp. NU457]
MNPRFAGGPGGDFGGGPTNRQRNFASTLHEQDALITTYEHLTGLPDAEEALLRLRKIASLVKPIMRKRGWHVQILSEFLPQDQRLLGLNVNHGYKICIRLRYSHAPATFLNIDDCIDTMLHELSHIVFGPHDAKFNALWDELRDERETLVIKGYTGEGFLTKGHQLGGGRVLPPHELRRLARQNAEQRRDRNKGSGQRLGGRGIPVGQDPRNVIVGAIERRNTINRGCASNNANATQLANDASRNTTSTRAEEDDANDRAIAQALLELMEEEENRKLNQEYAKPPPGGGLTWTPEAGLTQSTNHTPPTATHRPAPQTHSSASIPREEEQLRWAMEQSLKAAAPPPSTPSVSPIDVTSSPLQQSTSNQSAVSPELHPFKRARLLSPPLNEPVRPTSSSASEIATALNSVPPLAPLPPAPATPATVEDHNTWTCEICTLHNPINYLACGACGVERPFSVTARTAAASLQRIERQTLANGGLKKPETLGWSCTRCGTFMEHMYWTCSICGLMKGSSRVSEHAQPRY